MRIIYSLCQRVIEVVDGGDMIELLVLLLYKERMLDNYLFRSKVANAQTWFLNLILGSLTTQSTSYLILVSCHYQLCRFNQWKHIRNTF